MKEIIILIGSGRAGKTTYAEKIKEKKGHEIIDIDANYHYKGKDEYLRFLDFVAEKLNANPKKNFILDGYIGFDDHFTHLKGRLKHHKIRPVVIFAMPDVILGRPSKFKGPTTEQIVNLYKNGIGECWNIDEFEFIDCTDGFKVTNYQKIFSNLITKQDVVDFLERLKTENYDQYYQTIELPFGLKIQGYNKDYEHGSWEKILKIFDFTGKVVADIGCFNGYFSFKAKERGARLVRGFDKCVPAIKTAREISNLKGIEARFNVLDIEKEDIDGKYDVILFLNTSQNLKNPDIAFERVFEKSDSAIVEVQFSNISRKRVIEIAEKHNHRIKTEVKSDRPNRVIMLFGRKHGKS